MAPIKHTVAQGECLASIADKYGFFPDTIWNDPANGELKTSRKTPYALTPGDVVYVREKEPRTESGATEQRHRFRRKGVPEFLRVVLADEADQPLANVGYTIDIDGEARTDRTTDGEGLLEEPIPPGAARAVVTLDDEEQTQYAFELGHLDPVDTVSGAQARLANLGFYFGSVDGTFGPETAEAVREFRSACGLEEGDQLDDAVRGKLEEAYGR